MSDKELALERRCAGRPNVQPRPPQPECRMEHNIAAYKLKYQWFVLYIKDILGKTPVDFSWKIRWRMRNDRNPLFTEIQDKYKVKEYAKTRGIMTAEVYHVTDNPYTIDFDSLPEEYFIKANHGCGWNLFGKDGEIYNFKYGKDVNNDLNYANCRITREECIRLCKKWLKRRYSHREWAYRNIEPKIMIEESLVQKDGDFLIDYRCHTFNGVVKAIEIDSPMFRDNEGMIVDRNGRPFKLTRYKYKYPDPPHEIPGNFREIIRAAETLGKELDYIRVDLYNTTKGIALGEMTIYPYGGGMNIPTGCPIFDRWLGDQWVLPESPERRGGRRIPEESRRLVASRSFPCVDAKPASSCPMKMDAR